jgi:hypothetical protein
MSGIIETDAKLPDIICNRCANHIYGLQCKAFAVIPMEIISGENDHSEPLPDQGNNVVFEPKQDGN